jgi:hypothetical protein
MKPKAKAKFTHTQMASFGIDREGGYGATRNIYNFLVGEDNSSLIDFLKKRKRFLEDNIKQIKFQIEYLEKEAIQK